MIFWQAFLVTCGALLGLAVAIAAFVGLLVIAHVGKEAYDERQRRVWKNEPPSKMGNL
jgi:hypothetical protein